MSVPREPRSAEEIRSHFLERLNLALIRPGMYGGELSVRLTCASITPSATHIWT